jgi:hypothetical protein
MRSLIRYSSNQDIFQYYLDHYYPQFLEISSPPTPLSSNDDEGDNEKETYFNENQHIMLLSKFFPQTQFLIEQKGLSHLFHGKVLYISILILTTV